MKNLRPHFKFKKHERSGIFFLLLIIILLQGVYFYLKTNTFDGNPQIVVNTSMESKLDSLRKLALQATPKVKYPFNPNYITDYKGYTLGMSTKEIDRLHAFRELDRYINSAQQFQEVTKISDSMLGVLSPFFKFPVWTQKKSNRRTKESTKQRKIDMSEILDINSVAIADLKKIDGIGNKLSARIVKFRDRLGGFLINEQLYDVYGLDVEVADRVLDKYQVLTLPSIKKININNATSSEISSLVYITYQLAERIVELRRVNGRINTFDELTDIEGFPSNKLDRITLYLSL